MRDPNQHWKLNGPRNYQVSHSRIPTFFRDGMAPEKEKKPKHEAKKKIKITTYLGVHYGKIDILQGQFSVRALDFLICGVAGDAKNLIRVPPCLLRGIAVVRFRTVARHFLLDELEKSEILSRTLDLRSNQKLSHELTPRQFRFFSDASISHKIKSNQI